MLSPGGEGVGSSPTSGPNWASPGLTWVVLHLQTLWLPFKKVWLKKVQDRVDSPYLVAIILNLAF